MTPVLRGTPDASMQVVVARDAQQLASHIGPWEELAASAIEPNVFYEPWHLLPALQAFGKECFCFLFIYANFPGKPPVLCGFFPLETRSRYKGLPVRVLSLCNHDYCSLCTPLVRAGYEKTCLEAFLDWLANQKQNALLEMETTRADGPFHRFWTGALQERAIRCFVDESYTRALLYPTSAQTEEYLHNALSRKRRKELKRLENRLAELGQLDYEVVKNSDALNSIEEFLQLEASGWKGQVGTAFASQETHSIFFREVAKAAAQRDRLMLLALRLKGRAIAMKFNLLAGHAAFACKIAYDEEYARFSPGVLLELYNIHLLHENGALHWMDSCAIPDHFMINRLWTERRLIQNSVVSSSSFYGDLVVSLLPSLRSVKRRLRRKQTKEGHEGNGHDTTDQ
jgi:CelD/BcsL family acetyltransferase involved in cellulose biosynthesis